MKVLVVIKTLGVQIMDNQKWITGNVLIKEMTNDHLANAIAWCWRREESFRAMELPLIKQEGFTVAEWRLILKAEYNRRVEAEETRKQHELEVLREELEFQTKSVKQIKDEARRLLSNGDEASLKKAKQLLEKLTN